MSPERSRIKSTNVVQVYSAGRTAMGVALSQEVKITAVFESSFYVEDESGRLACFLREDAEPGPLNILCRKWRQPRSIGLREGEVLRREEHMVATDAVGFDFSGATPWIPENPPSVERQLLRRGAARFAAGIHALAPAHASVINLLFPWRAQSDPDAVTTVLLPRTRDGMCALSRWLRAAGQADEQTALQLAGLGPGLTPSGDDIIAGLLVTLRSLGCDDAADTLAGAVERLPEDATNRISRAHLDAAAAGEGAEAFHAAINDAMNGGGNLLAIMPRFSNIGHSSGWDAALGIIAGFDFFLPEYCLF